MTVKYPKLGWNIDHEGGHIATTDDFALRCRLRLGGEDAGTWSAIMNNSSLTSGNGKFGYRFDDENHAKASLEKAMRDAIDARIIYAKRVLENYTTECRR